MKLTDLFSNHNKIVVTEFERLTQAVIAGKLSERVNTSAFDDENKHVGNLVNQILDAIIQPLNVAANYVDNISKGNIPVKITDTYNGDFNILKNNLNTCIDAVNALVADANVLAIAAVEGRLTTRADATKHQGDFRKIVEGVNHTLDAVITPLNVAANYVERISHGDTPPKITDTYNGDFNTIKNNLNQAIDAINQQSFAAQSISEGNLSVKVTVRSDNDDLSKSLIRVVEVQQALQKELQRLTAASKEGQLSERGRPEQFKGAYAEIIGGVNEMLDAILIPIGEGNGILAQISNGQIDELIAKTYKGDHEKMKQAVNNVAITLQGLQKELQRLTAASKEGLLSERGKPEQFKGAYAEVVGGVNEMLDAILLPIGEGNRILAQVSNGKIDELIAPTYKGDHEKMKLAVNNVATTVQGLQKELQRLTTASKEGQLSERGKPEQFKGAYAEVVGGVNEMLDAILLPIGEGNRILVQISSGQIDELIAQTYKGDHEKMKQAVNNVATTLQGLLKELQRLIEASKDGQLSERGKPEQFKGAYSEVISGINSMLDAIILPVNEAVTVLGELEKGNLTKTVNGHYKGQLEDFKNTLNNTIAKIAEVIGEVNSAASNIASASEEVSATAQSMSQATSEQAASVEETSSAVEQMSASISQNTENAKVTDSMANQASSDAVQGGDAVRKTVSAMKSIAGKIGIIDDIAYQTNLLALNAAIEAARAGEHGKGFAVVAAEVRNLAERSQVAAQEIGELASSSVEMAENAGKLLDTIVPSIKKTADLVQEITAASEEQSTGVAQINTAMNQLNQITQQNASSSEELAATSEEMSGQAMQLQELMEFFTVTSNVSASKTNKHPSLKLPVKKATPDHHEFNEDEFVRF